MKSGIENLVRADGTDLEADRSTLMNKKSVRKNLSFSNFLYVLSHPLCRTALIAIDDALWNSYDLEDYLGEIPGASHLVPRMIDLRSALNKIDDTGAVDKMRLEKESGNLCLRDFYSEADDPIYRDLAIVSTIYGINHDLNLEKVLIGKGYHSQTSMQRNLDVMKMINGGSQLKQIQKKVKHNFPDKFFSELNDSGAIIYFGLSEHFNVPDIVEFDAEILHPIDNEIIEYLASRNGKIIHDNSKGIADSLGYKTGSVHNSLRRLRESGLVKQIALTSEGKDLCNFIFILEDMYNHPDELYSTDIWEEVDSVSDFRLHYYNLESYKKMKEGFSK